MKQINLKGRKRPIGQNLGKFEDWNGIFSIHSAPKLLAAKLSADTGAD